MKHSEYRTAVNNLHRYDNAYFSGSPLISDAEYDRIYFSVQQYEEAHPDRILPDSPTQYAHGEVVNGHRKVARRTIMLSTEKANSSDKVARWMSKTSKLTNDYVYSVEWKYDGLSASLVYINGELTEASYGKGAVGMDFLSTALQIPSIPNSFPLNTDSRVEVRGEVVVPFDKLPKGKYKDCRSAASGILGDTNTTLADRLLFIPYWTDIEFQHGNYPKLSDRLTTLCALGFYTHRAITMLQGLSVCQDTLDTIISASAVTRKTLPWPTDGLVIKVLDMSKWDSLGATDHHTKNCIAYKFPAQQYETTVTKIEFTIGEKGRETPVAHIKPVYINGREYSKCSVGSRAKLAELGIKQGSHVLVSVHNDVLLCIDGIAPSPSSPSYNPDLDIELD